MSFHSQASLFADASSLAIRLTLEHPLKRTCRHLSKPFFGFAIFYHGIWQIKFLYSATSLVRPKLEELIPEKNSLEKIPKPLKRWMGRSQLLPEIVENVLRSLFWAAGSKQPSPCLQPPKVGGLLRHLLLLLKAPLTSLHFWSQIYMDFSQLWFRFATVSDLLPCS